MVRGDGSGAPSRSASGEFAGLALALRGLSFAPTTRVLRLPCVPALSIQASCRGSGKLL